MDLTLSHNEVLEQLKDLENAYRENRFLKYYMRLTFFIQSLCCLPKVRTGR